MNSVADMNMLQMKVGFLCFLLCSFANCFPISDQNKNDSRSASDPDLQFAKVYLNKFYTLPQSKRSAGSIESQLQAMQYFFGLTVTGKLNIQTLNLMHQPRCGVPDVAQYKVIHKTITWPSNIITYRIVNHTPDLPPAQVTQVIRSALKVWSEATPLDFIQLHDGTADIMISFGAQEHGDFFPFDGSFGILAHAFSPGKDIGGDVHFDEDETWTMTADGSSLFIVAVHELGHALGLDHSSSPTALMFPLYKYVNLKDYSLPAEDILGIQQLYGSRSSSVIMPKICSPVDAIAHLDNGTVVFKDRSVRYYHPNVAESRVFLINSIWKDLPDTIDAAYNYPRNGTLYIFSGRTFWTVDTFAVLNEHARDISELGFPVSITKVDAAVHLTQAGKTYFFAGDLCWSYDEKQQVMDNGFPKPIEFLFPGIGNDLDAAFEHENGSISFFRGTMEIAYDPRKQFLSTNNLSLC